MTKSSSISVYGYDSAMLSQSSTEASQEEPPTESPFFHRLSENSSRCPLLALPLELRQEVLRYVLPSTTDYRNRGVVWLRGHTAILAASKLLYSEGIRMTYGDSTIVVDVKYDGINFAYQWLLPNGLCPKRHNFAFPGTLAERVTAHIRYVNIRIHHVDNYTGMVKHGFEGPGLREGLRMQVEKLCTTLRGMYQICRLRIYFKNDSHTAGVDQQILKPFLGLTNVHSVEPVGAITEAFTRTLNTRLTDVYERNSLLRLPLELRERVYDLLLPYTESLGYSHPGPHKIIRWRHRHIAILSACWRIHAEASSLLYRTRIFQLTCGDDHFRFTPYWLPKGRFLPGLPFLQSIGMRNLVQIRHFLIYMPAWWGSTDGEGRQRRRLMLKSIGSLLRSVPRITSLTLVCFRWNIAMEYEEAMHEILGIRGVSKVEISGMDGDLAAIFKNKVQTREVTDDTLKDL